MTLERLSNPGPMDAAARADQALAGSPSFSRRAAASSIRRAIRRLFSRQQPPRAGIDPGPV